MITVSSLALEAVRRRFERNFTELGECGAAFSLWQDGREVLHLCGGMADPATARPWTEDTLVPVWSASKGPAVLSLLMALDEAGLNLETRVAEIWPEFAQAGKSAITVAHLLSHRAGLCALPWEVSIWEGDAVIAALEQQEPLWTPGTQQGYHPRTFGFLIEALLRRLSGSSSVGEWLVQRLTGPMAADFWLGLPSEGDHRVARVRPGRLDLQRQAQPFFQAFLKAGTLTQRSFHSPRGLNAVIDFNHPEVWRAGFASMGGVASARGLASIYAMLACGGQWQGRSLVSAKVLGWLGQPLSQAEDVVLMETLAFSAGMMLDPCMRADSESVKLRQIFGPSLTAFGHPGAGGSLAFADPENRIAMAYVPNHLEPGALPSAKALGLVESVYSAC
jgi:CubicO group peptidase (beta-lactamase class C family)